MIRKFLFVLLLSQVLAVSSSVFDVDLVTLECKLIDYVVGALDEITTIFHTGYRNSDVSFLLWTRNNGENDSEYKLQYNNLSSLQNSPFDGAKKTYFIIHGFTHNGKKEWVLDIKSKILSIEDANVISLDMREPLSPPIYTNAVCNVYKIAKYNAEFIKWLTDNSPLTPSRIHLIGHSLGAHISGLTGYFLQDLLPSEKIGRITGLDPAGPSFYTLVNHKRLNKSQAKFVDIIHTNGCDVPAVGCLGLDEPLGHLDFYPNGGVYQPGCCGLTAQICSHERAFELFAASIVLPLPPQNLIFNSWPCCSWTAYQLKKCEECTPQCLAVGFHLNSNLEALKLYLSTEATFPYAKGSIQ